MKYNISIRGIFNLIFGLIVLFLIIMGAASLNLFNSLQSLNEIRQNRYDSRILANELRRSSDDLTKFARLYVTTGDSKYEKYYWNVLEIRNGMIPRPENYNQVFWDFVLADSSKYIPGQKKISLIDLMKEKGFTQEEFDKLIEAQELSDNLVKTEEAAFYAMKGQFNDGAGGFTKKGPPNQELAIQLMCNDAYQQEKAKIMTPINEFIKQMDLRTSTTTMESRAQTFLNLYLIYFLLLVILLLTIFSYFIIQLRITRPINHVSMIATQVASGDLSVEIKTNLRNDEVGKLHFAFNNMVKNLQLSIAEITEAVNLLGTSSSEILAATSQVAAGSSQTSAAIGQTVTTVEEIKQAAQLSSRKASHVAENAQEVALVTKNGQKAVNDTVNGIKLIQNQMETIATTIVRLSEQSQQIGGIIASVDDVADQSNLLAVNAAIEAAKAGEHGKGFAVVAQEIKNLALMSKQATLKVRSILSDVQKATTAAVMATEQGSKTVEIGVKTSNIAGDSIRELSNSTGKAVEAATQIVASSQQQVIGIDQIGLAMNNINQAGTENAASMMQAERSAKNLNDLGQKLKLLIDRYKI